MPDYDSLAQQYDQYKGIDHKVWNILYTRQLETIDKVACREFKEGIGQLGFNEDEIPEFTVINKRLMELTGWQIYAVPGLIPNGDFFERMFLRLFGATTWMRKMEELDYLEEPDMFHDVFGHIPLLTDPFIADYLHKLAKLAVTYINNEEVIEAIARLYWYTIEFGLIREDEQLKIYGAGILSSIGETEYCLSDKAKSVPFNLDEIIQTPYIKDEFQQKYFVLESLEQLPEAVQEFEVTLKQNYAPLLQLR